MAGWQPQQAGLVQLCNLLTTSQKGENQAQILQQLEQYKQYPDFNNYLTYIFAAAEQVPVEVRQSSGLYLKNSLRQTYATTDAVLKDYIKAAMIPMLAHPQRALRHTAGSSVSAMVVAAGLGSWPQLVQVLTQCLSASDHAAVDGGLDTLFKIIEESPVQMEATMPAAMSPPAPGAAPDSQRTCSASVLLVPPLLKLLQSAPSSEARRQALACLNLMARDLPGGILENLDAYLHSLFALATDVPAVKQEVIKGMVQLLTLQPNKLQPFLNQVIEYMIQCNESKEEGIALESCEFWRSFCEARLDAELLWPFVPRIIPMLMKNMVFDEHDEEVQEAQEAEAAGPQSVRASELKPVHHRNDNKHGGGAPDEDDEDEDDEALGRWSLRRCSASGLDHLAVLYGDALLPLLMPIVEQRLQESDWRARESAILALGAVAEGCHMGLLPYLGGMVDMLLPKITDTQPMVRMISCWALTRYSYWLLAGAQEAMAAASGHGQSNGTPPPAASSSAANLHQQLGRVIQGLLTAILDHNKFVQDSACSSAAQLCQTAAQEDAGHVLLPHLPAFIQVLSTAIKQYSKRNINLACDALCMLGEAVGSNMRAPELANIYLTPVCERLSACGPHDRELVPLFECVIMACTCMGPGIANWASNIYQTALRVAMAQQSVKVSPPANGKEEYEPWLFSLSLDVVDALCEGLGASIEPLVSGTPLLQLMLAACEDADADVRQSGFGLAGDLAKAAISLLLPAIPQLAQSAVAALAHVIGKDTIRSCNNATWSLGEMAVRLTPEQVVPWAAAAAERLAGLLAGSGAQLPRSLVENCAIALGRVSWRAPDLLAPHLGHFCVPWCQSLRHVRDDVEKEQAFHGLCALLARNPEPVTTPGASFTALAISVTSWRSIRSVVLQNELKQVLHSIQSRMVAAGSWQAAVGALEPAVAQKLSAVCGA